MEFYTTAHENRWWVSSSDLEAKDHFKILIFPPFHLRISLLEENGQLRKKSYCITKPLSLLRNIAPIYTGHGHICKILRHVNKTKESMLSHAETPCKLQNIQCLLPFCLVLIYSCVSLLISLHWLQFYSSTLVNSAPYFWRIDLFGTILQPLYFSQLL